MAYYLCMSLVIVVFGGEQRDDAPKQTLANLKGTWQVTSSMFNGTKHPAKVIQGRQMVFHGKSFTSKIDGRNHRKVPFALDTAQKPVHFDLIGKNGERRVLGILRLKGDQLEICYCEPDGKRPAEFTSRRGSRLFLMVLQRVKEKR